MSANDSTIHIIHFLRSDGTSLFLHPFHDRNKFLKLMEKNTIKGLYGDEPKVPSLTYFRNTLYKISERAVKDWITEARFIPKFLVASGMFLFLYFFFSFVIRDPLPMLDEIAISLSVALIFYFVSGKKDLRSESALKKRVTLRTKVDKIKFEQNTLIKKLESLLQYFEKAKEEEMHGYIFEPLTFEVSREDVNHLQEIADYIEKRFSKKDFRSKLKKLSQLKKSEDFEATIKNLKRYEVIKKFDLPLFLLYTQIKETLKIQFTRV